MFLNHKYDQVIFLFINSQWLPIALRINQYLSRHLKRWQSWPSSVPYWPQLWLRPNSHPFPVMRTPQCSKNVPGSSACILVHAVLPAWTAPTLNSNLSTKNQLKCHLFQEGLGVLPLDTCSIWEFVMLCSNHYCTYICPPLNCELPKGSYSAVFDFWIPKTHLVPDL